MTIDGFAQVRFVGAPGTEAERPNFGGRYPMSPGLPLIVALLAVGSPAGECPPGAHLFGEPAVLEPLVQELSSRGIGAEAPAGCKVVEAKVERSGEGLSLWFGPSGTLPRTVADLGQAATLIEAHAREDLLRPLLRVARPTLRVESPRARRTPTGPPPSPAEPEPLSSPSTARILAIRLGGVLGGGVDGSAWSGFDAELCLRVGWTCLGGRIQYALDLGLGGEAETLQGYRSLMDLQAIAEVPVAWALGELSPGIGVGLSVLRSGRVYSGAVLDDDASGLRLRAQLALRLAITRDLALRGVAAVDYAPTPHRNLSDTQGGDQGPVVALVGEPAALVWLKLGLELGGL